MRLILRYWKLAALMFVVGFVLGLCGCDGTGVMGSPTVVIKADGGSTITITDGRISVTDGGFAVPNLTKQPTTRPKE